MKSKLTTYVEPDVFDALNRLATARRVSVSSVASELLEKAVKSEVEFAGESLLMPVVEEVIRTEFKRGFDRLARLLVRNGLESGTSRRLLVYFMSSWFENEQLVQGVSDQYWKKTVEALRTPLQELPELVEVASRESSVA
ncbi:hypothetical protein Deipe_4034 (plasmid) [Deinococcus peraridilitoris DSM 19664]|uniref:Ribbon-helix-helix protein, copG family n=2 Tax=Deinococcus TaxID=1298 RepID=L0A8M2_DEIPD|nr:hypothetical protein Deipe_4034 [Deinococcus peraridilitoris DSM 19664]